VVISNKPAVAAETTVDMFTKTTVVHEDSSTVENRMRAAVKPEDDSGYEQGSMSDMATVATADMTTVSTRDVGTVVMLGKTTVAPFGAATVDSSESTTVDTSEDIDKSSEMDRATAAETLKVATVDENDLTSMARFDPLDGRSTFSPAVSAETESPSLTTVDETSPTPVDRSDTATVVMSDQVNARPAQIGAESARSRSARIAQSHSSLTTVDRSNGEAPDAGGGFLARSPVNLWVTDDGDLVSQSRVRRIRIAQDVVNSTEEAVYDTLWNTKAAEDTMASGSSGRIVQAGYDYLMKRTRLSKKTIQRVIDRLIHKDFIAIEKPADIYRRISTIYRVFDYRAILAHHLRKGRTHVAKIGPGFTYARPINDPRHTSLESLNLTTVGSLNMATVYPTDLPTAATETPVTGANRNQSTVVQQTIRSIDKNLLEKTTSASTTPLSAEAPATTAPAELISGLQKILGFVDTEAATLLWDECRFRVPDCGPDEVLYFAQGKASVCAGGKINNPVGFLLTTVPKCFEGPAFANFRREEQRKAAEEQNRRRTEEERLRQIQEQGREEADALELGKRRLDAMSPSEFQAVYEKTKSAFLARYPNALRSAPKTIEDLIQQEMIRGLQN
jgi:predicted transcriptional regulator